jgi:hypothetical protein
MRLVAQPKTFTNWQNAPQRVVAALKRIILVCRRGD